MEAKKKEEERQLQEEKEAALAAKRKEEQDARDEHLRKMREEWKREAEVQASGRLLRMQCVCHL
jgi:hypothetical protein